jgi:hypothetical protein
MRDNDLCYAESDDECPPPPAAALSKRAEETAKMPESSMPIAPLKPPSFHEATAHECSARSALVDTLRPVLESVVSVHHQSAHASPNNSV